MGTPNKYHLINIGSGSLFPECQADFFKPNLYEFDSYVDIIPGDFIRIIDNHYFMGMAKVVRRVLSDQCPSVSLYCERVDPRSDYVFTKQYEVELIKAVIEKRVRSRTTMLFTTLLRDLPMAKHLWTIGMSETEPMRF